MGASQGSLFASFFRWVVLVLGFGIAQWATLFGQQGTGGDEFFEKRIRPLLEEKCLECHSARKKIKGGLSLDSREAWEKGGDSGKAIHPRDPDSSRLIEAVRYKNRDLQMPPKGSLSEVQIQDLENWVRMGAPDPRTVSEAKSVRLGMSLEEGRKFWSFQALRAPSLPSVKDGAWGKTPVDAFILSELEKSGLKPAPVADKGTLIRRATFDLIGLPPTWEEVSAFLADESPEAFSKVIERLLASPHYGERWGRHWLDVARYADSNGMDENVAFGNAWRYRDYVVAAFNRDKPFDQFIVEQIAGDLLPAVERSEREEALTATGFLALGGRVLAEPDRRKMEMDIIDEQLDVLGKAFLGMTFGCARCHDHKFDPVTQGDYYAMAAIFRSTQSIAEEKNGAIHFSFEHSLANPAQREEKKKYDELVKAETAKVTKFATQMRGNLRKELQSRAADYLAAAALLGPDPDFESVERLAKGADGLRSRYLLTCRQYLDRNPEHPLFEEWRVWAAVRDAEAIRGHYGKLFNEAQEGLRKAKEADPKLSKPENATHASALEALEDVAGFLAIPAKEEHAFEGGALAEIRSMRDALKLVEDGTPDPPSLMGVSDGKVAKTLPIHIRGNYLTLGKEMERGFPEVMKASMQNPVFPSKQSGRLQLARWMTNSEHPLTARVMVNRIWRWHFGRGLVASTENFGVLGERPSHPDLLDWLARNFMEEGWSVKSMHRLLMNSSVYQMGSSVLPVPASVLPQGANPLLVDPENRLFWKFNLKRLEAEEVQDALLAVSGSLDRTIGGKTLPLRNREFVFNHTSNNRTVYDSKRRALYLPVIRNSLYELFEQFDYPDPTMPTGSRNATVVAPQALILLNAPVVMNSARILADRVCVEEATGKARIQRLYETLYAREPDEIETDRALKFVSGHANPQERWALLCHTLMAANEFLYLR